MERRGGLGPPLGDGEKKMTTYYEAFQEAKRAATLALVNAGVDPMTVVSDTGQSWVVNEGLCGFAWVSIPVDARTKHGKAIKSLGAGRSSEGGMRFWSSDLVPDYRGQSYERQLAGCKAAAEVLMSYGIQAHAGGRLD